MRKYIGISLKAVNMVENEKKTIEKNKSGTKLMELLV
jgi:hypothetical protein